METMREHNRIEKRKIWRKLMWKIETIVVDVATSGLKKV